MRVLTLIGLLSAGGIAPLGAQHAGQVEIGAFGSYTRYDSGLQLDDQFGGGARVGYFLGKHFSLEVDANVAQPLSQLSGVGKTTVAVGSASLVISSGSAYVLGGYSRLYMGPNPPYYSELNALHGGLGERIFFVGDHVALGLEARGYDRRPGGVRPSPTWVGDVAGHARASSFVAHRGPK